MTYAPHECGDYDGDGFRDIHRHDYFWIEEEDDDLTDGVGFADPGGESALRAATPSNPRNLSCPTCGEENVLTPADVAKGYQCNTCAARDEGTYMGGDY